MAIILHAAIRQVWAIDDSLRWGLTGSTPQISKAGSEGKWLLDQGMDISPEDIDSISISGVIDSLFSDAVGIPLGVLEHMAPLSNPKLREVGSKRSSAGWQRVENFIITSAFVRLLGASEQFELDALKALLYYRPQGLSYKISQDESIDVEDKVVLEEPELIENKQHFKLPTLWTWIKRHAENNVERSKLLSNVYGIKTIPEGFTGKQREQWYESRNAIAHGRKDVTISLKEYVDVQIFAVKSMLFVFEQCKEKFDLII